MSPGFMRHLEYQGVPESKRKNSAQRNCETTMVHKAEIAIFSQYRKNKTSTSANTYTDGIT